MAGRGPDGNIYMAQDSKIDKTGMRGFYGLIHNIILPY